MKLYQINKKYSFHILLVSIGFLKCYALLQAQTGQRFKRIDYDYDQISGKVNEVHYQAGNPDAFYHKYKYDADNRITHVYTSKDSFIWDQDAGYTYYVHGPLARVELGENNVQGMDYVYTLQGWIKGVNSNLLKAENDIGNDGLPAGLNSKVAKDALGYTLNYQAGDYKSIDVSKWNNTAQRFEALTPNSDLMAARFDLYNGNIGSMVTTIQEPKVYTGVPNEMPNILPQGTAYRYDQLNRLLEMKAFQNLDAAINTWQKGSTYTGLYHNAFKYDANGNILGQFRANGTGTTIDSLTYKYVKVVGRTQANRLYHVNDQVNPGAFPDDIDDQGAFNNDLQTVNDGISNNYQYDEIGNLIKDKQEGIDKIEWTVYGKIKSITRLLGSLRSDLEFLYDAGGNRIAKIEKPRDAGGLKPPNTWFTTYYTRDAQRNVMGIYKHNTVTAGPSFKVIERHLYGSSRLGSDCTEVEMVGASIPSSPFIRTLGNKNFEGSNHLGNVLTVFSDRKIPKDDDSDGAIDYFQPEVLGASDYSPFGVLLDGRFFGATGRYSFNGQEKDDEVNGYGNFQDYGMRTYDVRLGRFLSVDPLSKKFPWWTSYQFASNKPINAIDLDGLEAYEGPNNAKDVMSLYSWQNFAQAKFDKIKDTDLKSRPQYDCSDFVITVMAEYYKEKGVRLLLSIPGANGTTVIIDSNNPKYKGENAFNDFVEDLKINTGAKWIRDELSTKIPVKDFNVGDMYNFGFHVGYNYPDAANPPTEPFGVIDASGGYEGKNSPNNSIIPVSIRSYEEVSSNVTFRWKFLNTVPSIQASEMEYMIPIKIDSIPEKQLESPTIIQYKPK